MKHFLVFGRLRVCLWGLGCLREEFAGRAVCLLLGMHLAMKSIIIFAMGRDKSSKTRERETSDDIKTSTLHQTSERQPWRSNLLLTIRIFNYYWRNIILLDTELRTIMRVNLWKYPIMIPKQKTMKMITILNFSQRKSRILICTLIFFQNPRVKLKLLIWKKI